MTHEESNLSPGQWPEVREGRGVWKPAVCWHDCGGRCMLKALVVDGQVARVKTDDTHPDSPDYPQQRACVRGRSQRMQVCGPDRLLYPMRRKNWKPGGGRKDLRGRDEWVRISWDEALDSVAGELRRIKEKWGNSAIYCRSGEVKRTLNLFGGCVDSWVTDSLGSWMHGGRMVGLYRATGNGGFDSSLSICDRMDLRQCRLIVMWGVNPAWSSPGSPTWHFLQAKKAGAKFVFIDPFLNSTAALLADDWFPVRPGTDHALALGLMHTMLSVDAPGKDPMVDWDFLNRCTVGFDAAHMPAGADPADNFRDYLEGKNDGMPKSAEWAASICGLPAARIRTLAREISRTRKTALLSSWAPARINNADSWPQAFMTLGCMAGHFGESGRMTGTSVHLTSGNGGPALVRPGSPGNIPDIHNPVGGADSGTIGRPSKDGICISGNQIWDAILTGQYRAGKDDIRTVNIQMVYHANRSNMLATREGLLKGIAASRIPEFIVSHAQFATATAKYADIVLPVTTPWERRGPQLMSGNREILFCTGQVIEPVGEARDDMWIARELASRLGLNPDEVDPLTPEQMFLNSAAGAKVINADGTGYGPLVTITEEDIRRLNAQGQPQQGRITLTELVKNGSYQVPRAPHDRLGHVPFQAFRADPAAHPLTTASGKLEIYCQALADFVRQCGWTEIRPIPVYVPPVQGYEESFASWPEQRKGTYPLQFFSVHYMRRAGSTYDNVSWLREAWPQEFFINPLDAAARGIKDDDTVRITSANGAVIRRARVTPRIMPGVTCMGANAWPEVDEDTKIDTGGNANTLSGPVCTGQGTSGWNTTLVQVEKHDTPLAPDMRRLPKIIPAQEAT